MFGRTLSSYSLCLCLSDSSFNGGMVKLHRAKRAHDADTVAKAYCATRRYLRGAKLSSLRRLITETIVNAASVRRVVYRVGQIKRDQLSFFACNN